MDNWLALVPLEFFWFFVYIGGSYCSAIFLYWVTYTTEIRGIIFFWHDEFESTIDQWEFGKHQNSPDTPIVPAAQMLDRYKVEAEILKALAEKSLGNVNLFLTFMILSFAAIYIVWGGLE